MFKKIAVLLIFLTTACVYKLDVHQGNILEQKDVDKLRFGFTKNQVVFVLGNSVLKDSFSSNKWIYLYQVKNGDTGEVTSKKLVLEFVNDKLMKASGDFEIPKGLQGVSNKQPEPSETGDDNQDQEN